MYGGNGHRDPTLLCHVARMVRSEISTEFWWGNRKEGDSLDDLGVQEKNLKLT